MQGTTENGASSKPLDLNDLNVTAPADSGTVIELEHPVTGKPLVDDEGKPYYVDALGDDATEVRKIDRKHADRRAEKIRRGKDWADADTLETESIERLTAATRGWYLPPMGGKTVEFNRITAREVYGNPGLSWIVEQVTRAMRDRKRFFATPSSS
jgi:hypothetical protein